MSHYKPYPAYKNSEVEWLGKVPEHWVIASIRYRYSIVGGSTPQSDKQEYWDGDISWITPSDLSKLKSFEIQDSERKITEQGLRSCGTTLVPTGSVILSTRAPIGSLGVTTKSLCTNQGCKALVIQGDGDSRYLAYILSVSTSELNIRGRGATFLELSSDELGSFRMAFPSNPEQQAIAAHLDRETARIDALVAKKTRFIELLREKRQSLITHAVTKGLDPHVKMKDSGVEWLGEVPAHWAVTHIKRLVTSISQGWSPECEPRPPEGDEWGVLKVGCVNGGKFRAEESKLLPSTLDPRPDLVVRQGDVLVSRANTRELVGSCAVVPEDFPRLMLCDKLYRLTAVLDKVLPGFLSTLIVVHGRRIVEIEATGASSSMVNIAQSVIMDLTVALPDVNEQKVLLAHLENSTSKFDLLIEKTARSIDLLKERRAALITAAVTGQIDLREAA